MYGWSILTTDGAIIAEGDFCYETPENAEKAVKEAVIELQTNNSIGSLGEILLVVDNLDTEDAYTVHID